MIIISLVISLLFSMYGAENGVPLKVEQEVETTTYYFIRHAEKDNSNPMEKDPPLSDEGRERVGLWIKEFKDVPLDAIYSTSYKRTRETAEMIAEKYNIPIKIYDPRRLNDINFQRSTVGKQILVVGHSNTNPVFVNEIIGENKYGPLNEEQYSSIFTVTLLSSGEKSSNIRLVP